MCVCLGACMLAWECVCVCVCVRARVRARVCACARACARSVCVCACARAFVCVVKLTAWPLLGHVMPTPIE